MHDDLNQLNIVRFGASVDKVLFSTWDFCFACLFDNVQHKSSPSPVSTYFILVRVVGVMRVKVDTQPGQVATSLQEQKSCSVSVYLYYL